MSDNASLKARREAATPRGVGITTPFFVQRAENSELWDVEGRRYIDFAGGIAVLNTGHRHPSVVEAIKAQLDKFMHTCFQVTPYASYIELCERLNRLAPGSTAKKSMLFSTGAEAVENAMKIARYHTKRSGVIAFSGSFHGRTLATMTLTGKVQPYKAGFGPFPAEIYHVPFPGQGASLEDTKKAMEQLFKCDIEPSRVAAIVFEPVQGEGGFNVIQKAAVQWLRELCDLHGIVLIADEVQTGFARTGKMFALEHYGVSPDLMTMAKSMAGGTTLSAVVGRAPIMDAPAPGGLGGTYAGNPLAIAAAHAVLDIMREENLVARANLLGERLVGRLKKIQGANKSISEVRGLGAMIACEFVTPETGAPDADRTKQVQQAALKKGLLLLSCGVYGNVLRFLFPLTIEDAVFDEALHILDEVMAA